MNGKKGKEQSIHDGERITGEKWNGYRREGKKGGWNKERKSRKEGIRREGRVGSKGADEVGL